MLSFVSLLTAGDQFWCPLELWCLDQETILVSSSLSSSSIHSFCQVFRLWCFPWLRAVMFSFPSWLSSVVRAVCKPSQESIKVLVMHRKSLMPLFPAPMRIYQKGQVNSGSVIAFLSPSGLLFSLLLGYNWKINSLLENTFFFHSIRDSRQRFICNTFFHFLLSWLHLNSSGHHHMKNPYRRLPRVTAVPTRMVTAVHVCGRSVPSIPERESQLWPGRTVAAVWALLVYAWPVVSGWRRYPLDPYPCHSVKKIQRKASRGLSQRSNFHG